ncbi:hypothetical protein LGN09_24055 [Burkholderia cenocepacia]|uniref:hypothetical protein n=1 Tax=Burkholderia cenocepacia TaxID=95486 RepID=UPI001CF138A2|nr:hypothetical protein [Burkholderia cenocepacia]MCA8407985.1 hypothetical protein [Burkholderia cenocepacia]
MQMLERDELYDLVWKVPMIELGKRYGVSRDAIRWACIQLSVPLPPQGYWGALRAGKEMERPALPLLQPDQATSLNLVTLIERDMPRRQQHVRRSAARPTLVERLFGATPSPPEVPDVIVPIGYKWQQSVQAIRKVMDPLAAESRAAKARYDREQAHLRRKGRSSDHGPISHGHADPSDGILGYPYGKRALRVSLNTYERGLVLLNDIVQKALDLGFSAKRGDGRAPICLHRDGAYVSIRLIERVNVRTQERKDARAGTAVQDRYTVPSGRLDLVIEQQGVGETVVKEDDFIDTATGMPMIIRAIEKRLELSKAQVARWARDEQRRKEEALHRQQMEKQRLAEQKQAEAERERRDSLVREAQAWQQANALRLYLAELDRRLSAGGEPTNGYQDWRQWAEDVARDLDVAASRVTLPRG